MNIARGERNFWVNVRRFFEPCMTNKIILWKALFVAFLWGINGIAHVIFLERLTYFLLNKPDTFPTVLIIYIFYLMSYEIVNFSVRRWWWVELLGTSWNAISREYITRFIQLDNNAVESIWTGKLISIINTGIEKWGILLWDTIEHCIALTLAIVFAGYMIAKVNPLFIMLLVWLFLFFFFFSYRINKKMSHYRKSRNENYIEISKQVVKILMSKNEILQSGKVMWENNTIESLYSRDIAINKSMGTLRALLTRNIGLWISIILVLSYFFLWFWYLEWRVELSILIWLSGALIVIQKVIYESLTFYIDFTKEFIKVSKLWDFFDTTPDIAWYDTWAEYQYKNGDIELRNMTFWYGKENKIFENFDLSITWWKITAFVGNSGWGKTTLMKLISQYIRQESGDICIDGHELSTISLKSYYQNIGYLTQEPSVFDGTILENLTYALHEFEQTPIFMEKLQHVIESAKCEFIYDFENWLNTEIWERWVRLSGWQKQRLAIAKIMLKNPKIIFLDEPTSALDSFSEELISSALHTLFEWRTVIIIAHRLQTVRHADDIIVIEWGKVVERGDHASLIALWWIYYKMLELQSGF